MLGALEQFGPWHGFGAGAAGSDAGDSSSMSAYGLPEWPLHPASARVGDWEAAATTATAHQ